MMSDHEQHHAEHESEPTESTGGAGLHLNRRQLVRRLTAAGLAVPAVGAALTRVTTAEDATPTPKAAPLPAGTPFAPLAPKVGIIDPSDYSKDSRLIKYDPADYGMPLELADGLVVPNSLFFIRSHGPTAFIEPADWRLNIIGLVENELELKLEDLQALPNRELTAFLECSGDSRGRFQPKANGTQWGNTAIGNAVWRGVALRDVLAKAGVKPGAVQVVTQGGDFAGFQRGLPIDKALNEDTMLVWEMNGEPLPVPNGGPVRLLVPGWGGVASTKWIIALKVIDTAFQGPFNTKMYIVVDKNGNLVRPVFQMPVKSVINKPTPDDKLTAGVNTIAGYAWSGYGGIQRVDVSIDGGTTWAEAPITASAGPYSWVRFEYPWNAKEGAAKLQSRAIDTAGYAQPTTIPWNKSGYQMNAIYEVEVNVSSS